MSEYADLDCLTRCRTTRPYVGCTCYVVYCTIIIVSIGVGSARSSIMAHGLQKAHRRMGSFIWRIWAKQRPPSPVQPEPPALRYTQNRPPSSPLSHSKPVPKRPPDPSNFLHHVRRRTSRYPCHRRCRRFHPSGCCSPQGRGREGAVALFSSLFVLLPRPSTTPVPSPICALNCLCPTVLSFLDYPCLASILVASPVMLEQPG